MKILVIFLKHLIGPSSAEANDTYTCVLFKLMSLCDDEDAIWDFSLFYDLLDFFHNCILLNKLYFCIRYMPWFGIVIDW